MQGNFKCEHCKLSFSKSVSLGGHLSKAHAGKSKRFTQKMEVYARRQPDRENLLKAKKWFAEKTGLDPRDHRVLITSIKKDFMAGREPKVPEKLHLRVDMSECVSDFNRSVMRATK